MTDKIECEVCGIVAGAAAHPCRFERACDCWRGMVCKAARTILGNRRTV